jgi:DHA1 family bicyclomycin/chloramphenicol resistance-like MFS transporter
LAVVCAAGTTSAALLVPLLMVTLSMRGFIAPNLQHLAMVRHAQQAGTASAIIGTTQLLSGALVSAAVALLLPHWGPSAVAIPMALLATAALILPAQLGFEPSRLG